MRETSSATPTVVTDKADYNPGSTVTLTGANWGAEEAIHINVNDDVGQAWKLDADVTASAEGNFIHQFQLPDFFIADYAVTATGASGQVARTTFTDAVNLQFNGKDGSSHNTAALEENLGTVSAGTAVAATCVGGNGGLTVKATGLGGAQSISWAISYASGYGNNSSLSTPASRTTISPSSFTQNGNGEQCVTLSISSTGLAAGTYHGELQVAQTAGATANTEFYFFAFTVAASTANTTTSAADATATFGDTSVSLSATVTPNTVYVGTVTFTVKNGGTTVGTVTSGTVVGGAASASFPLAGVNAGTYTIQAAYSGGTGFNASNNSGQSPVPTLTVNRADQAISFAPLGNKTFGDPAFTVSATGGSSGNPVTFSVGATDDCASGGTNGSTITITGAGSCTVTANQAGNTNYDAAPSVSRSFLIAKASQSISITTHAPASKVFGQSFTVAATASSGLPVSFSSAGGCSNAGDTFTMTSGTTSCTVKYNQAGNDDYEAAPQLTETVTAQKADQEISITAHAPASKVYGGSFTVAATGGGSGNPVSFSSAGGCSNAGDTFTMTSGTTSCTVKYDQAGNDDYEAAPQLTETVTAQKADQEISVTTPAPASKVFGQSFTVAATASSGLPVSFNSAGGCSNLGATFTMTSGTTHCTVKYDQAGNENYDPAPQVTSSVDAEKADQAPLSITSPDDGTYDQSYDIVTSGGDGTGALSFDVGSSTACSIVAGKLKITSGTGNCAVTAQKAGDENYNPVTSGPHAVTVHKATQAALSVTSPSDGTYDQSYDIVTSGGSGTGALSFDVGSSTACSIVAGKLKITSGTGDCAVTATKAADDNYNETTSPPHSVTVHKADQTITFAALANKKLGDPDFVVTATASSGLAVSFVSQTTSVCTMSGSTVHIVTIGTCTIRASQAGNTNYNAAPNVDRSFGITYVFHGFFQPVDNDKWNAAQAGSAIPVKFDLSGNQGLSIFASGYPKVTLVTCPTASTAVDSIEETVAATNSGLQYDPTVNPPIGQYIYVWKTDKSWANTCRQLDVKFVDGSAYWARFQFKR